MITAITAILCLARTAYRVIGSRNARDATPQQTTPQCGGYRGVCTAVLRPNHLSIHLSRPVHIKSVESIIFLYQ